ncbi:tail fiber assembly protein [Pantoea deleyi]|uniref:tail fiber assembly protein n=1 Tax=Pantoea deleyi TaxID=470932 RepID=UPI0035D4C30C
MKYIQAVQAADVPNAPDISWPKKPEGKFAFRLKFSVKNCNGRMFNSATESFHQVDSECRGNSFHQGQSCL